MPATAITTPIPANSNIEKGASPNCAAMALPAMLVEVPINVQVPPRMEA